MMSWGYNGSANSYTSNREYGRGVLMSMQKQQQNTAGNWNSGNTNAQNFGSVTPAFSPGHAHEPSCPNFGVGMNPMQQGFNFGQGHSHLPNCPNHGKAGQMISGANGGIYSTGGNSPTDFTVYVGDAATAEMAQGQQGQPGQGGQEYKVNYYMPGQPNVSEGNPTNFPMNYHNNDSGSGSGDQGQNSEPIGQLAQPAIDQCNQGGDSVQQSNPGKMQGKMQGRPKKTFGLTPSTIMTPAPTTTISLGNKYRNRQSLAGSSDPNIPGRHIRRSESQAKPSFRLCGRCTKCKNLKDPNDSGRPSTVNFNVQGLTPNGSRRFSSIAVAPIKPQATPSPSLAAQMPGSYTNLNVHVAPPNTTNTFHNSSTAMS